MLVHLTAYCLFYSCQTCQLFCLRIVIQDFRARLDVFLEFLLLFGSHISHQATG